MCKLNRCDLNGDILVVVFWTSKCSTIARLEFSSLSSEGNQDDFHHGLW